METIIRGEGDDRIRIYPDLFSGGVQLGVEDGTPGLHVVILPDPHELRRLIDTLIEYEQEILHAEAQRENQPG